MQQNKIKLLDTEEVAQILGVTPDTVRRWLRLKWIKGVKLGQWKITEKEVQRVLSRGLQCERGHTGQHSRGHEYVPAHKQG